MDPNIWGTKLWSILDELVRPLSPYCATPLHDSHQYYCDFVLLVEAMQFILPCRYCRESFQQYLREYHPLDYRDRMVEWLWTIHRSVNEKLNRKNLPLEKYQKRMEQWATFCSAWDVWDVAYSLAANLCDDDQVEKRLAYYIFFRQLAIVCAQVPILHSIASAIQVTPRTLANFTEYLSTAQVQWLRTTNQIDMLATARCTAENIVRSSSRNLH